MIPRTYRLTIEPNALRNGRVLKTPSFAVKYAQNGLPHPRFGVVVSKKAGKTAVARHLIKRALTEGVFAVWQKAAPSAQSSLGYDILFIASPALAGMSGKELRSALVHDLASIQSKLPHNT